MRIKEIDVIGDDIVYKNHTIKFYFEMRSSCIQKVFKVLNCDEEEIKDKLEGLSQAFYFIDNFTDSK